MITKVKGTDEALLKMQDSSVFKQAQELSLDESDLDTSDLNVSLQLGKLVIEDSQEGAFASTPCKEIGHRVSVAASIDAVSCNKQMPGTTETSLFTENVAGSVSQSDAVKLKGSENCFTNEELQRASKTGTLQNSDTFYFISSKTRVCFNESRKKTTEECNPEPKVTYDSIGGLNNQLSVIREMIELPLKQPNLFRSYGMVCEAGFSCKLLFVFIFFPYRALSICVYI